MPGLEALIRLVADRVRSSSDPAAALEDLAAPVYVTDVDGVITHYSDACIDFAGRTPRPGVDRWCVSWRLLTDAGEFMPHEACPTAVAIRERRAVRGLSVIAERPDGTRIPFTPYPTPIFDDGGAFIGAVNLLADLSDARAREALIAQARQCRRLADASLDEATRATLNQMAAEYEARADALTVRH